MTRTIAERLEASATKGFIGRRRELSTLAGAADPPFLAAFVHGPGGIGKTRLLRTLFADPPDDVRPILLDGRDVEPTPRGMRLALARELDASPDTAAISRAIEAGRRRIVIAIDTYEVLGLLDTWLRTTFLPALPASVLTVFAGRDRPSSAWHTAPGWSGLVAEFPLAALSPADAAALLRARGLDDDHRSAGPTSSPGGIRWRWSWPRRACGPTRTRPWRPRGWWRRSSGSCRTGRWPRSRPRPPCAG